MGVPVFFGKSALCANQAVHNINLLGVDFMNSFVLVDDSIGNYLQLLTRPSPGSFVKSLSESGPT